VHESILINPMADHIVFCRDRVMETVSQSKILPPEMSSQRLGNVNLFMRAIGLDVEMLG
jgi:DNA topoisomerase 2-associated protein PAT1